MILVRPAFMLLIGLLASPVFATSPAPETDPAAPAPGAVPDADADAALAAARAAGEQVLDTVVVSGVQPGPGLWKVSRDGHVLWVLGTLAPLPKRMEWNSDVVAQRIAGSGVVLLPPTVSLEAKGAALGGLFLLPSLMKARNNPGKERLAEVLPPADYANWQALKARYLPRDNAVEKRRPILAAMELRDAAFDDHDLSWRDVVQREVKRVAKANDVPVEQPKITLVVEDAKDTLKEFSASPLDDLACFRDVLTQVRDDLDTLALRANAWALGDLAQLERLTYTDEAEACIAALMTTGLAERSGFSELPARAQAAWLDAAEKALAENEESFAVLSLARVVGPRGYLKFLEEKGYQVEAPAP